MQVNGTRMLRVRDVADRLDVSPQTIYRAIEAGQLVALRIAIGDSTGAIRVPESALAAFAELCTKAARHQVPELLAHEGVAQPGSTGGAR